MAGFVETLEGSVPIGIPAWGLPQPASITRSSRKVAAVKSIFS
jgi:hypothetical protein